MSRNRTIALILAISAILSQANAATFQGVGGLSDHIFLLSECWGVSGDGSVAFGSSIISSGGWEAFRWTAGAGIQSVGDLPGGHVGGYAFDSSYDGSVIVGRSFTNNSSGQPVERAYVWTQEAGMEELPLPDDPYFSDPVFSTGSTGAFAVSADGQTVAGLASKSGGPYNRSIIWDLQDNTATLMDWPYNTSVVLEISEVDISANGSTILVSGSPDSFLWTQGDGYGTTVSGAIALSGDGSAVLGNGWTDDPEPYRDSFVWNQQDGKSFLGALDGWSTNHATVISYDGSTVAGYLFNDPMQYEDFAAYIWNEQDGVRLIQDILENDYNLDLTGWTLTNATGISDDGLTLVGNGINPDGVEEGWIATIPEPATIILLALGSVILSRRRNA